MKVELRIQAPMGHKLRWFATCRGVGIAAATPTEAARLARSHAEAMELLNS